MPTSPLSLDRRLCGRENDEHHGLALVATVEARLGLTTTPSAPEPQVFTTTAR